MSQETMQSQARQYPGIPRNSQGQSSRPTTATAAEEGGEAQAQARAQTCRARRAAKAQGGPGSEFVRRDCADKQRVGKLQSLLQSLLGHSWLQRGGGQSIRDAQARNTHSPGQGQGPSSQISHYDHIYKCAC